MHRSLLPGAVLLTACALFLIAPTAPAQINSLPQLGAPVPASLVSTDHEKRCHTGTSQVDPCTDVRIADIRYTIAWDAQTKAVTYLFTDDPKLVTDNGLAVGNSIRVRPESGGEADTTYPYMKWFIDPKWKDTDSKLGSAVWYAALHKDYDHHFGDIVGFVQSRYLQIGN